MKKNSTLSVPVDFNCAKIQFILPYSK